MRSIKTFSRWMGEAGWTDGDRLKGIKTPQSVKPHIELVPNDEMQRLVDLYSPNTFLGSRNRAIITVLGDTGTRREECANDARLQRVDALAQRLDE